MDIEEIIRIADAVVSSQLGRPLSDRERHVLRESFNGKKYREMEGWAEKTLKDTGSALWDCFTQAVGGQIKVRKSTFQSALTRLSQDPRYNGVVQPVTPTMPVEVFL